ncbi:trichome birefringence-like protein 3 [Tanacetum coccineum]
MDDSIGKVAPTLKSCRKSSQVRNIEGIMIGKDGKPLMPIRPNRLGGDVQHVKPQSSNTETVNVETVNVAEKAQGDDAPHAQNEWDDNGISAMRSTEIGTDTVNIPQKRTFANVVNGINSERVTKKIMSDEDGMFYFKFSSRNGLEQDEVKKVPVWVKLHKVPVVAYSEDDLSLIATQIGDPIMLDAFTSAMCVEA